MGKSVEPVGTKHEEALRLRALERWLKRGGWSRRESRIDAARLKEYNGDASFVLASLTLCDAFQRDAERSTERHRVMRDCSNITAARNEYSPVPST